MILITSEPIHCPQELFSNLTSSPHANKDRLTWNMTIYRQFEEKSKFYQKKAEICNTKMLRAIAESLITKTQKNDQKISQF